MWSKQNYFCWSRSVWKEVMTSSDLSICFVVCLFICFVLSSSIWIKQTYLYLVTLTLVEVALQLLNGHAFCSLCDEDCYSHNKKLHLWRCVSVKDGFWTLSLIHVPQGISFLHQIRGAQMSLEDIKTQSFISTYDGRPCSDLMQGRERGLVLPKQCARLSWLPMWGLILLRELMRDWKWGRG